jgi:hypothetical protein
VLGWRFSPDDHHDHDDICLHRRHAVSLGNAHDFYRSFRIADLRGGGLMRVVSQRLDLYADHLIRKRNKICDH